MKRLCNITLRPIHLVCLLLLLALPEPIWGRSAEHTGKVGGSGEHKSGEKSGSKGKNVGGSGEHKSGEKSGAKGFKCPNKEALVGFSTTQVGPNKFEFKDHKCIKVDDVLQVSTVLILHLFSVNKMSLCTVGLAIS